MTSYKERERKRRNEYLTKHTIPGISGVIFMIKMFREKEFASRVWIRNVLRGCLIGFSVHAALFVHSENRQMNNKRIACAYTLQSETRRKNKPKKNFKLARAYILILPLCGCWMFVWTQKKRCLLSLCMAPDASTKMHNSISVFNDHHMLYKCTIHNYYFFCLKKKNKCNCLNKTHSHTPNIVSLPRKSERGVNSFSGCTNNVFKTKN